jgi:demethylmenaquinone methyltransferase/2-methoxy-6-polyprenyl-1,4-benzoquinol methylase
MPSPEENPEDSLVQSKSPEKVQRMFNDISGTYDLLNHALSLNIDKRWRTFLARQVVQPATSRILDVCGGTGDLALALREEAQRQGANPVVICSDFTEGMMRIGQTKFQALKPLRASAALAPPLPLIADTTRLPFADSQFDGVTVAFGIRNVANPQLGLQEMARVCRPGGVVAVLEFSETRHPVINSGFRLYFRRVLPLIGRIVTGTRAYSYLSKSVEKFPEGEAFAAMLTHATGSPTQMHRLSLGIATLYLSWKIQKP